MILVKIFFAAALFASPLVLVAGCETVAQSVQKQETSLAALGFVDRPANTPVRKAMLEKLPPQKFLRRSHGNHVFYIYADPLDCQCLYVGSQKAYAHYRQFRLLRVEVKQIRDDAFADALAGSDYSDASWATPGER